MNDETKLLRRSPWSSPSTRLRKRTTTPSRDSPPNSPVFDESSPSLSKSPLISGKRPLRRRLGESLDLSPKQEAPRTGDKLRSSFSLVSSKLSRHSRDSAELASIGRKLFHNKKEGRATVRFDREIVTRPGLERYISVQHENPEIGITKYIEPIGRSMSPYDAFRTLKLARPKLAKIVQRVLDEILHHGSQGQNVHWSKESSESFTLLSPRELQDVASYATDILTDSPTLVNLRAPVKVFGDLHGQFLDLLEFFRRYGSPSHRHGDVNICNYVFAGDLVDRGARSLEVLSLLLCLKIRYHPRIVILRGNHEDQSLNMVYGFRNECVRRLGEKDASNVLSTCWRLFEYLPLACLVDDRVLCLHGGLGKHVKDLDQIRRIKKPVKLKPGFVHEDPVVVDILWSDPIRSSRTRVPHARVNTRRGVSTVFTSDDVEKFCIRNDIDLIIRAHECVVPGWSATAGGRCITVFSAPKYCGTHRNAGALLEINRDLLVQCKKILCDESEGKWVNVRDATPPPSPTRPSGSSNFSEKRNFTSFEHRLGVIPEVGEDDENDIVQNGRETKWRPISPPPPPPPPSQSLMLSVTDIRGETSSRLVVLSPRSKKGNVVATVGRSTDCKVTIPNTCDLVSREHLRIELIDGKWFAVDVSSMGTACRQGEVESMKQAQHLMNENDRDGRKHHNRKKISSTYSNEGNDHRLKPSKPVAIEDGMHFFLGSYRAGGAVVKAKLLSPKSASIRRRRTGSSSSSSSSSSNTSNNFGGGNGAVIDTEGSIRSSSSSRSSSVGVVGVVGDDDTS